MKLVFATNNTHKIEEVSRMLNNRFEILSLSDIGFFEDVDETGDTFEANATLKSRAVYERFGLNCFADDSGLEVFALDGKPGVHSARFAGGHGNHAANNQKLLDKMSTKDDRRAQFRTVISLITDGHEQYFEGIVKGALRRELSGKKGFGYDPLFQPDGYDITFAEMGPDEKNRISHRGRAIAQMVNWLMANGL